MARRDSEWSLSIKAGIEAEQKSFDRAAKIFDAFYNKYNDKSVKIDTSDLIATVRDGISAIKQLYDEGTNTPTSWLNLRPEMKASFDGILSDAEEMFSNIKVMFNNGQYIGGMDNILQGFRDQLSVVFSDIGGLYDDLNQKQKDISRQLDNSIYIRDWYDEDDIRRQMSLINELADVVRQMGETNPSLSTDQLELGLNTRTLSGAISRHQAYLDEMQEFNLQTAKQVEKRREIIDEYNDLGHYYAWDYSDEISEGQYDSAIKALEKYITERRELIEKFKQNENELFSVGGIFEYTEQMEASIAVYQNYLDEYKKMRGDDIKDTLVVPGNLSEVVDQLKEIKEAINAIKVAFEPLTKALSAEDSALHKMLTASIEDLNTLESRLKDVYQMIDDISKKDFNITQQTVYNTRASTSMQSNASFSAYKEKAQALIEVISKLVNLSNQLSYSDGGLFANVINQLNAQGRMSEFFETLNGFDPANFAGKIAGAETNKDIKNIVGKLTVYKDMLLDVVNIINSVKPGTIDTSFLSILNDADEKINKINSGIIDAQNLQAKGNQAKTTDATEKANEIGENTEEVVAKVKTLGEQIEAELTSIRAKIEATFDFSTIDPKLESVKSITDAIYQQFVELQDKISALDLNLAMPTVIAKVNESSNEDPVKANKYAGDVSIENIDAAAELIKQEGNEAEIAAQKKREFIEANKLVAESGEATKSGIKEATDAIEEEGKAAVRATDQIQNAFKEINNSTNGKLVTINGTSYKDFQDFAMTLASSNNMKIDDVSVVADGDDKGKLATIRMVNEELAQSVVYTYRLKDSEEEGTAAYLERYKASSNINKALKIQLAAQKKADAERLKADKEKAKNNEWLIKQQSKLDTQERKYKHSNKSIDGSTALMSTDTSLAADADKTIDSLAKHIRDRIQSAIGGTLTDNLREEILNDIRILQNEISVEQGNKYSATNMKASSVETNKKVYAEYLKAFTANAKKSNVFDQMQSDIHALGQELAKVSDAESLDKFIDNLRVARGKLQAEKTRYAQEAKENKANEQDYNKLIQLQNKLHNAKVQLAKVDAGSARGQKLAREVDAMQEEYDVSVKLLNNEEQRLELRKRQVKLNKELKTAQEQPQTNYGKTIYNRESKYFDTINAKTTSLSENTNLSDDFLAKLEKYKASFKELEDLREQFANNPDAFNNETLKNKFQTTTLEVEGLRKEILGTFREAEKFDKLSASGSVLGKINIDSDKFKDAKSAMIDFAATITDGQFKFEGFNAAGTEMYGTLSRGEGVVEKVTVALREGTNQLYAYKSGTKEVSSSWSQLGKSLTSGVSRLATMYLSLYDIIRYVRKGVTYVKEIDLAMTELKKVTDETDATYKNFLKTASSTSAVIGSTVSDFTDATAAFARLGYSIDESSKMAETAIVYKNVADGLDTIEESTESIISTMKAYGIEANDTMGIIDRFNAVGNNFAITSAGIGEAMQRSASALYEGGNSIDESIGLITAANSVVNLVPRRYSNIVT